MRLKQRDSVMTIMITPDGSFVEPIERAWDQ